MKLWPQRHSKSNRNTSVAFGTYTNSAGLMLVYGTGTPAPTAGAAAEIRFKAFAGAFLGRIRGEANTPNYDNPFFLLVPPNSDYILESTTGANTLPVVGERRP